MTPLQLCEIFEEFPQTLFTTQAGASSSAAAGPFVTAVHCSDKENILSVDFAKYLSLLAGQNDHNGRPRAIRFGSDEGNNLKFKKVIFTFPCHTYLSPRILLKRRSLTH